MGCRKIVGPRDPWAPPGGPRAREPAEEIMGPTGNPVVTPGRNHVGPTPKSRGFLRGEAPRGPVPWAPAGEKPGKSLPENVEPREITWAP